MGKYRFEVSRKAETWFTDNVEVEANSPEEAKKYIEENAEEGMTCGWDGIAELYNSGVDYETVEYISEEENGNQKVLEIKLLEEE